MVNVKKIWGDTNYISCSYGLIENKVDFNPLGEHALSDRDKRPFIDWTEEGFLEKNLEKRELPKKMERLLECISMPHITKTRQSHFTIITYSKRKYI